MKHARILVAEDDPVTARFVTTLLSEKGYEVLLAEDGDRAAELAANASPDLILCDVVLPYRDGFDLLREFRSDERLRRVPVFLLSVRDREEDVVRAFELGADDYIVKPFNARELLARIGRQLEYRKGI
jgi:DNA-binding response OmpR family regulator